MSVLVCAEFRNGGFGGVGEGLQPGHLFLEDLVVCGFGEKAGQEALEFADLLDGVVQEGGVGAQCFVVPFPSVHGFGIYRAVSQGAGVAQVLLGEKPLKVVEVRVERVVVRYAVPDKLRDGVL